MKFSITRDALLKPLQIAVTAVDPRPSIPVLGHVLLRIENEGELTIIGTDLEVEQRLRITEGLTVHNLDNSAITVPAKKLLDVCRALPDSAILEFSTEGDSLHVKSSKSKFKLSTLSANDFPNMQTFEALAQVDVSAKSLVKTFQSTAFSMADNDVRYYLNGMLMEFQPTELTLVSTDGHRLSTCKMPLLTPIDLGKDTPSMSVIVPRKSALNIMKFLDEKGADFPVSLAFNQNFLQLVFANQIMTTKLIDGRFPDYRRVLPKALPAELLVDRALLHSAVQRVSILSNSKYRGGSFLFGEEQIECAARNEEHENASEIVASTMLSGNGIEIGFNLGYMLDVLSAIKSERVRFFLPDNPNSSSSIVADDVTDGAVYVLMPMRL